MKDYEKTESVMELAEKEISIFDLRLEDLVYEKMFVLFERLEPRETKINETKAKLEFKRNELLRTIDFKQELGISTKPTKDDKEAVMKPYLAKLETELEELENTVRFYKLKLNVLNDLISTRKKLLDIEIGNE